MLREQGVGHAAAVKQSDQPVIRANVAFDLGGKCIILGITNWVGAVTRDAEGEPMQLQDIV